ncbi:MAG TPA: tetratricopeptide repeat protein [Gemmataceae bacterium]|jgi:hypothetical protein|nr:tetratricopeptide repeat protein [Gemmataceae bacterium]
MRHLEFGRIAWSKGDYLEARDAFRRAVRHERGNAEAWFDLASACDMTGDPCEALQCLEEVARLGPYRPDARFLRGTIRLLLGEFPTAWSDYRAFYETERYKLKGCPMPMWDGVATGQHILLYSDQGLGDAIQFLRYVPQLRQKFRHISFYGPESLGSIIRLNELANELIPDPGLLLAYPGGLRSLPCEYYSPLSALPGWFGADIPLAPYLRCEQSLPATFMRRHFDRSEFKVGIAWKGSRDTPRNKIRSFTTGLFRRLIDIPNTHFYVLQKDATSEEMKVFDGASDVTILTDDMNRFRGWDIMATAAAMMQMNLVITCDNMHAHLAGAIGRTVWVGLPYASEWRWQLGMTDSPWYPTSRLFRQPEYGCWEPVFDSMASELLYAANSGSRPQCSRD